MYIHTCTHTDCYIDLAIHIYIYLFIYGRVSSVSVHKGDAETRHQGPTGRRGGGGGRRGGPTTPPRPYPTLPHPARSFPGCSNARKVIANPSHPTPNLVITRRVIV